MLLQTKRWWVQSQQLSQVLDILVLVVSSLRLKTAHHEAVSSNPPGCWAFSSSSFSPSHNYPHQYSVLN